MFKFVPRSARNIISPANIMHTNKIPIAARIHKSTFCFGGGTCCGCIPGLEFGIGFGGVAFGGVAFGGVAISDSLLSISLTIGTTKPAWKFRCQPASPLPLFGIWNILRPHS
jgi:hypothetical protein